MSEAAEIADMDLANALRVLAMDGVEKAKSGHPGMPMGMADVALALYRDHLKFDAKKPGWADRDRFVLSAGHGSMLLYSLMHLTGYEDMPMSELKNFRQLGSKTAGHPEYGHARGIETTTGPLGQGLANAVGMAMAERLSNAHFGDDLVDHHTYCIVGDGCLMEGISQEAIGIAGHHKLNKLIVLWDDNAITIDGPTSMSTSEDVRARFEASAWNTIGVDGHDTDAVSAAIEEAKGSDKPTLIACKTTIGFGSPNKGGKSSAHGSPMGASEIELVRAELNWTHAPFEIPANLLDAWRAIGLKGAKDSIEWEDRLANSDKRDDFNARQAREIPAAAMEALKAYKAQLIEDRPTMATRSASGKVLEVLAPFMPNLIGGSSDLSPSNNTRTGSQTDITAGDFSGSYVRYGIREHGMAAVMNGMSLHGDVIPYGGTFLVFTDYCRPSIRLSALMKQRVIYVMTHDSIGLGEDGPTHQPIEHLASLRAIPGLLTFRPADALEVAEAWEIALQHDGPSVIALSRQNVPFIRNEGEMFSSYGAYINEEAHGDRQVTLLSTGSEMGIIREAQTKLADEGISAAVVSMPCWELFDIQPQHYREDVLGPGVLRVAIEAAGGFGWEKYIGFDGVALTINGFGASAPIDDLYKHFNLTADAVVEAVKQRL